ASKDSSTAANITTVRLDRICTSNDDNSAYLKQTQAVCLLKNHLNLLIGLENGDIILFNIENFSLNTKPIVPNEVLMKNIPENCHGRVSNTGPVQSIVQHPTNDDKILIGYKNCLIVQWDLPSNSHDRMYVYKQEIESLCWYNKGLNFASCHTDGSYALWNANEDINALENEKKQYGPYPCMTMKKILVKIMRNGDSLIIFSGGLQRSGYSTKHSVSCVCENEHEHEHDHSDRQRHVAFDFTTPVIDFFTIDKPSSDGSRDDPQSLVILLKEEIVFIDLITDSWPSYRLPYLNSIHACPVICTTLVCNINQQFYKKLTNYGNAQCDDYSDRKWPLTGGDINNYTSNFNLNNTLTNSLDDSCSNRQILLTGHEDGSVQFWDVTDISMPLLYKLKTNDYFLIDQPLNDDGEEEETWPPFRKTGFFDPFCDDARLAIQKIALCTNTDTLVVAGQAGQIFTFNFSNESVDTSITATRINLIDEGCESYVWKGHEEMKIKQCHVPPGFVASSIVQLYPPASVSALALCSDIQTYAVGTAHGFTIFNYKQNRMLTMKCTLDPASLSSSSVVQASGETSLNRGRSLKKSLRESFRRLRKGRTVKKTMIAVNKRNETTAASSPLEERVPVERQVEFREFKPVDDQIISMVRCLYFAQTHLTSVNSTTRSLWAGTNGGHVYVYSIVSGDAQATSSTVQRSGNPPSSGIVTEQYDTCLMAKEIRLKHKAPVLSIVVLDGSNRPIGHGSGIPTIESSPNHQTLPTSTSQSATTTMVSQEHTISPTTSTSTGSIAHKVLICSEEQFKIFTLPSLKPLCKYKLTATEGARVRKVSVNQFTLKTDVNQQTSYSELCLLCLSNLGEISIYSLPSLRRQIVFSCIKTGDITALSSVQFTPYSHAFYLQSSSELAEVTFTPVSSYPYSVSLSFDKALRKSIERSNNISQTFLTIANDDNNKEQQQSPTKSEARDDQDNKIKTNSIKQNIVESSPSPLNLDNTNDSTLTSVSGTNHHYHHSSTISPLSKSSSSSPSQKINMSNLSYGDNHHHEKEEPMRKGIDSVGGNNSSINSDSAIDLSLASTSMNTTTKTNSVDENHNTVYKYNGKSHERELSPFQSTPLKISTDVPSSIYNGHSISNSSISPVEKQQQKISPTSSIPLHSTTSPAKLISVKVRQAPTINEIHCNGTKLDHQIPQLTSPQRTSAPIAPPKIIHT
ncbi:unnamed protein product, partial [Didymodactylos carnosus]